MTRDDVLNGYFEWLSSLVCDEAHAKSYQKLLMHLHNTGFRYSVENDRNRFEDGMNLRSRFAYEQDCDDAFLYLDEPCSVLEMLIALSVKCEEHIMNDDDIGNRTGNWFWDMIENLGLGNMTDGKFNKGFIDDRLNVFLDRRYKSDGSCGGLFIVHNARRDMRMVEIWYQMLWYLNEILN